MNTEHPDELLRITILSAILILPFMEDIKNNKNPTLQYLLTYFTCDIKHCYKYTVKKKKKVQ